MIKSFLHKGLQKLFTDDSSKGVRSDQSKKLKLILARLEVSSSPEDMDLPGFKLHQLKGSLKGTWAVSVNGNWRVTFKFTSIGDVIEINLVDYH